MRDRRDRSGCSLPNLKILIQQELRQKLEEPADTKGTIGAMFGKRFGDELQTFGDGGQFEERDQCQSKSRAHVLDGSMVVQTKGIDRAPHAHNNLHQLHPGFLCTVLRNPERHDLGDKSLFVQGLDRELLLGLISISEGCDKKGIGDSSCQSRK